MTTPYGPTSGAARAATERPGARPNGRFTLRRGAFGSSRHGPDATVTPGGEDEHPSSIESGHVDEDGTDWRAVGVFGAGLFLGAMIGASTALLLAPASGFETRTRLALGARRAGERVADGWDDAGSRVRRSAARSRRKLERKLVMARWRARDAWERKRYGADA